MDLEDPLNKEGERDFINPEEVADLFQLSEMYHLAEGHNTSPSVVKLQKQLNGVHGLINSFDSSASQGISGTAEDLRIRTEKYGSNRTIPKKTKSVCELIKDSFEDTILRILCVASVISLVIGIVEDPSHWLLGAADGLSIIVAIVIIVSVTVGNNMVKER